GQSEGGDPVPGTRAQEEAARAEVDQAGDGAGENGAGAAAAQPAAGAKVVDIVTTTAGESVSEGTILEWHKQPGEPVRADETVVEISTDKVDVELPAPASGTLTEVLAPAGETVTVGQFIGRIAVDESTDAPAAESEATPAEAAPAAAETAPGPPPA